MVLSDRRGCDRDLGRALLAINSRLWAWLAVGFLFSLVVAFAWTARDEHATRLRAEGVALAPDPRRGCLLDMVEALITRADYLASQDAKWTWYWRHRGYEEW